MIYGTDNLTMKLSGNDGNTYNFSTANDFEITIGIEEFPRSFTIRTTSKYFSATKIEFLVPAACQIYIGSDLVLTGYVESYAPIANSTTHDLQISGRSKGCDLVDCSAFVNPNTSLNEGATQISSQNIFQVAKTICTPFGITLSSAVTNTKNAPVMPLFFVNLGDNCYDVLEECARYNAQLLYDDANGNLILSQAGAASHSSGLGIENVIDINTVFDFSQRYSVYKAIWFSVDPNQDISTDSNDAGVVYDTYITRFRPLIIQSEQVALAPGNSSNLQSFALQRATWEMKIRRGRSQIVTATIVGFRDSQGKLWTPNYLVSVNYPAEKIPAGTTLLISKVTFSKSVSGGTITTMECMPKEAFTTEPITNLTDQAEWAGNDDTSNTPSNAPTPTAATQ